MSNFDKTEEIEALMLDDEKVALETACINFSKENIIIEPSSKIEDFEKKVQNYKLILSDLNLKNISTTTDGVKELVKVRIKNKSAFLVLFSAFTTKLNAEQLNLIKLNNIHVFDKKEGIVSIKNIKMQYQNFNKKKEYIGNVNEETKNKLIEIHYEATKDLALKHLLNISPSTTLVPLLKKKKLFTIDEMIQEIEADTEIGSMFILQYLDTLSLINLKKPKV
ncbi:hypothetical protein [Flavobacterium sp.]|uniref:hypothetical protein n=1 Tax=Flavobacterium sp. TaxID=239 RepID=UPI0026215383|nr:hypothetical protein [Flavobacterium sp.]